MWRGIKSTHLALRNSTALLEMFASHVVTLRWDLQACEFQEEQEFTKIWGGKKKFRSYLCHRVMVKEDTRHSLVFVVSKIWSDEKSDQEAELHKCTRLCGELEKVRASNQPECWQVIVCHCTGEVAQPLPEPSVCHCCLRFSSQEPWR